MNSNWSINRIGLIDFWYYDEEEFYFLDGRMLLRGANGSGKSVTMQSFIPLLLDGNMRPERLDPFGSRARKMDNYLLEENDAREERTGYLYMEFKRTDSNTYMSIGIGLRARKNKKLETWYFFITDGRRIGKDFFLFREGKEKITLSKGELRFRIGEGGQVLESQSEYMSLVNKLIFGFETMEEYKEMVDLLIQLRTPKLSKDFKPTIINEILSNSLQPLSEDDLRPMSEAIENMDNLKTNLDALKESHGAAKRIGRVYDRYNQFILLEKAKSYKDSEDALKELGVMMKDSEKRIEEQNMAWQQEEQAIDELAGERDVLEKEQESLNASDAKQLKVKEEQTKADIGAQKEIIEQKEKNLNDKKEKRTGLAQDIKTKGEELELLLSEIDKNLDEMEACLVHVEFDEHEFMARELRRDVNQPYIFGTHRSLLHRLSTHVEEGLEKLKDLEYRKKIYDERLQEVETCRSKRDKSEREQIQSETLLLETKSELKEQYSRWEEENQELKISGEIFRKLFVMVERFDKTWDYGELRQLIREIRQENENRMMKEQLKWEENQRVSEEKIDELKQELQEWETKKDPVPEQPEAVKKNREKLKEQGIPFYEFYKTVDFAESIKGEQANRIEEALAHMGILDSLIVAEEDRKKIYALDAGVCDKYIFSNVAHVKENIQQLLEVDNQAQDILFYQQVSTVLSAIGITCGDTYIDKQGNYRLGALSGTITKEYQAKFIGVNTRERYRQSQITAIKEKLELLYRKNDEIKEQVRFWKEKIRIIKEEESRFPGGADLQAALSEFEAAKDRYRHMAEELKRQERLLEVEQERRNECQEAVVEICSKVYLKPRLDIFMEARNELKQYQELLADLEGMHVRYHSGVQVRENWEDQLLDLDGDLDGIYYDLNQGNRKLSALMQELTSVQEQLKLTNYEEIKERLNHCVTRLRAIPKERENRIRNSESLKSQIQKEMQTNEKNMERLTPLEQRTDYLKRGFLAEYQLGYVMAEVEEEKTAYHWSKKVCQSFQGQFETKTSQDFFEDLQEVYHQNRGFLADYYITLESIFDDVSDESAGDIRLKRLDITGKYKGVTLKFKELMGQMEKDMETQSLLLDDKDRELFEDILANTISKKIRSKIFGSTRWVERMNQLMHSMETSSGLTLSLKWRSKRAEHEDQLDTKELVELLKKDADIMRKEEFSRLSSHFRSKIQEARKILDQTGGIQSFHMIMKEILDYRKWFEFQLECKKTGENKKELTDRVFFTFSGGEKAMAMYVPLFSAVVAKYASARADAPRLVSLDEAFAGVDEMNIKDMFRLMVELNLEFIINSQVLWGDCETVPSLAIYQLLRPENAKFVTVIPYVWNGKVRELVEKIGDDDEKLPA